MATAEEVRITQTGFPGADQLLDDACALGEKIRAQAEALASLSTAALVTIESPVIGARYFPGGWPLTLAPDLQDFLLAKATANINTQEDSKATKEEPVSLDQFSLCEHVYYHPDLVGVYVSYPSSGYPPTGFAQDLIKWADELGKKGWSVLAQLDRATPRDQHQFDVSVYPETATTRELLDEQTRAEEEYTSSQWLSERVLLHAYKDEFDRFDWTGSDS